MSDISAQANQYEAKLWLKNLADSILMPILAWNVILGEIMEKQGEEAFHQCEAEIISHYIDKEHVIVILEEAVVATEKNRKLLSPEFVVHLKVSTPIQIERWSSGRSPLLPITDLKTFLDKQHLECDSLFEEVAKLTLEPSISAEEDINKIIKTLEE